MPKCKMALHSGIYINHISVLLAAGCNDFFHFNRHDNSSLSSVLFRIIISGRTEIHIGYFIISASDFLNCTENRTEVKSTAIISAIGSAIYTPVVGLDTM